MGQFGHNPGSVHGSVGQKTRPKKEDVKKTMIVSATIDRKKREDTETDVADLCA